MKGPLIIVTLVLLTSLSAHASEGVLDNFVLAMERVDKTRQGPPQEALTKHKAESEKAALPAK